MVELSANGAGLGEKEDTIWLRLPIYSIYKCDMVHKGWHSLHS